MIPSAYEDKDLRFLVEEAQEAKLSKTKALRARRSEKQGRQERAQADFSRIVAGCHFLQHCRDDSSELPEPHWWSMVSIAAFCSNGRELVHDLSKPYPSYSPEETDAKIDHCLKSGGPHRCETIARDHGEFCSVCTHRGRITSPIVLGQKSQGSDAAIEAINSTYAVVPTKNSVCILRERQDSLTRFMTFDLLSRESFALELANKGTGVIYVGGEPKVVPLAEAWLKSPHRRELPGGIVFDPAKKTDPTTCYNLYQGFTLAPTPGDWSLLREHIRVSIADEDQTVFEFILHWLADLVQNPAGPRPGTALVLIGQQGTGKGFFVNAIGKILGPHFVTITDATHLTGRFNGHLAGCLLCFVDEGLWAGDHAAAGVLKARITEPTMLYEAKGKDPFPIANHSRFIIASNNSWVVPAGLEERRFLVLNVSNKHRRDYAHFSAMQEQLESGGYEAMLHELLSLDLGKVNLREIPRTESLLEQIVHSLPPVQKYWLDCLHRGGSFSPRIMSDFRESCHWNFDSPDPLQPRSLYADFLAWGSAAKIRHPGTEDAFFKDIRKLCDIKRVQRTPKSGARMWCYVLPSLDECRQQFEAHVQIPITWHTDEETDDQEEVPWVQEAQNDDHAYVM